MNLADDPTFAALRQKSKEIADRLEAIATRQRELQQVLAAEDIESRVEAVLAGDRREAPESELQALAADADTLRRARGKLKEELAMARRHASGAIARTLAPEHRTAAAGILDALDQLRQALGAEAEIRKRLAAAGADADALPIFGVDHIVTSALGRLERRAREYAQPAQADVA